MHQRYSFRRHIDIAKRLDLTLQIHDRDAHDDVVQVLREEGAPERVVFHCFSGDEELARICNAEGWYMSFAGTLTFKNAANLRAALAVAEPELVLVETDAPFLTPHPHRGRPNASYMVPYTVRAMAELTGSDLARLCAQSAKIPCGRTDPGTETPSTAAGTYRVCTIFGRFITLRLQWATISRGRGRPSDNFTPAGRALWPSSTGALSFVSVAVHKLLRTLRALPEPPRGVRGSCSCAFFPVPGWSKDTGNRGQVLHIGRQVQLRQGRHPARGARGTRARPRGLRRQQQDSHPERRRQSKLRPDVRRHRGAGRQGRQSGTAGLRPRVPLGWTPTWRTAR